ncbi:STAS domain-containing protein [Streptosporangium sp. NPDC001681]|uniref:STAS domain-containing protein n=1 Tax=Streptosporangium sp. NPDC001681 TaxID=3154395 RepID=UPI003319BC6B
MRLWIHPEDALQRLDVSVEIEAWRTVVHVRGEVDLATAELLGAVLDEIAMVGGPWVEVGLGQVPLMDCSGLRVLFRAKQRLQERGGMLTVCGLCAQVERLLCGLGLDHRLDESRGRRVGR